VDLFFAPMALPRFARGNSLPVLKGILAGGTGRDRLPFEAPWWEVSNHPMHEFIARRSHETVFKGKGICGRMESVADSGYLPEFPSPLVVHAAAGFLLLHSFPGCVASAARRVSELSSCAFSRCALLRWPIARNSPRAHQSEPEHCFDCNDLYPRCNTSARFDFRDCSL